MKHLCALLCIAALTSCASEPEVTVRQPREMPPHDAKLLLSSLYGNTNEMHIALQSGADINARQWGLCSAMFMTDATPLYASVVSKKPEAVRFLLDHGADASIPNHSGETALDLATRLKLDTIVKMLREKPSNKTPEHISEGRGRPSENAQR